MDWTVVLVSAGTAVLTEHFGYSIELPERKNHPESISPAELGRYGVRRLLSRSDEWIDLSPGQRKEALDLTIEAFERGNSKSQGRPTRPSGIAVRAIRPKTRGLLLIYPLEPKAYVESEKPVIGFAISFPGSQVEDRVSYVVNNVYYQQEFSFYES